MSKHAYVKAYPKGFRDKLVQLMQAGNRSAGRWPRNLTSRRIQCGPGVQQSERDRASRKNGLRSAEREEPVRLRRERGRLKQECEILSKAASWFARETDAIP